MLFFGGFFGLGEEDLRLCFCFFMLQKKQGGNVYGNMPWPPAAKCNMITNKQTNMAGHHYTTKTVQKYPQ